jgi:hypothetical protein
MSKENEVLEATDVSEINESGHLLVETDVNVSLLSEETLNDPDSPFHSIDDDRFFETVYVKSLKNEKTLRALGRDGSKALQHDAYSEAILLEENLGRDVKPAYH